MYLSQHLEFRNFLLFIFKTRAELFVISVNNHLPIAVFQHRMLSVSIPRSKSDYKIISSLSFDFKCFVHVFISDLKVATTPSLVTSSAATTLTVSPVLPLTSAAVTNLSVTGKQLPGNAPAEHMGGPWWVIIRICH